MQIVDRATILAVLMTTAAQAHDLTPIVASITTSLCGLRATAIAMKNGRAKHRSFEAADLVAQRN